MKRLIIACLTLLSSIHDSAGGVDRNLSILFVGNSLTSQNNLPGFVERLIEKEMGVEARIEAITRPGATMADHVRDGEASAAIRSNSFDFVILQERGGPLLCLNSATSRNSQDCIESVDAHRRLAQQARARGGQVLILGTYNNPDVAVALGEAEAELARRMGAHHLRTADAWLQARRDESLGDWFADDGVHPGRTMTALMGVLLHAKVAGECPDTSRIEWRSGNGSDDRMDITAREMQALIGICREH